MIGKILKFVPKVIGGLIFASYEEEGQIYRAEPVKRRIQIAIIGLQKDQVNQVNLEGVLKHDLLVTGISVDVQGDDARDLTTEESVSDVAFVELLVFTLNKKTRDVISRIQINLTSFPNFGNEFIISPDYVYQLKPNSLIKNITFTGIPVYLEEPLVFTDVKIV